MNWHSSTFQTFETKDSMVEPMSIKLEKWVQSDDTVKNMRLDNSGKNLKLKERANSAPWQLGINFDFTPQITPQQNHLAELGFVTIGNKGRALMIRAYVPYENRFKLLDEASVTATLLDGLAVITIDGKKASTDWLIQDGIQII